MPGFTVFPDSRWTSRSREVFCLLDLLFSAIHPPVTALGNIHQFERKGLCQDWRYILTWSTANDQYELGEQGQTIHVFRQREEPALEEFQIHQTARGADIHLEGRPQELTTTLSRQGVREPEIAFVKASHRGLAPRQPASSNVTSRWRMYERSTGCRSAGAASRPTAC